MRILSVSNTIKSSKKSVLLATTAMVAASVFGFAGKAQAVDDYADWDNVNITKGDAVVKDTGKGSTTIEQHSMRAIGEAQELHIGTLGDVKIQQGSKDALFVGRVIGDHDDPTQILGKLSADGRVMIIDRNGVFFGEGSRVDAAGIAVTTGDVSDNQIMSGSETLNIDNFGKGEIVVKGTVNVTDAGLAAFVAPTVKNSGVISAKLGRVVVASGEKVTLDMYGDGLLEVAVDGDLRNSLIENTGTIEATGGKVQLSAATAKGVVDNVVNSSGVVSASAVKIEGGKIILSGDVNSDNTSVYGSQKTTFTGKLKGGKNSTHDISGQSLELDGQIELGEGSKLSFDPVTFDIGAGEASTIVSALNNDGVIVNVEAQERINVNADINSSAQTKTSTLNLKDEDSNNDLRVDLNAKINLGANQTLTGDATTVNVSSAGKIQNGVDVARSGAQVNVAAGTYNEAVKVNKAVTLTGANAGIHGNSVRGAESKIAASSGANGLTVTASNVTIDGFEVAGGNNGVVIQDASNVEVKNNNVNGQTGSGVVLAGGVNSARIDIVENKISSKKAGVLVTGDITDASVVNVGSSGRGNTITSLADDAVRVDGNVSNSVLRVSSSDLTGRYDGVEVGGIGENGLVIVNSNTQVVGQLGSGVKVGHIDGGVVDDGPGDDDGQGPFFFKTLASSTSEERSAALLIFDNKLVNGGNVDGVTIGAVNNGKVAVTNNELVIGKRNGVNFLDTVDNAEILIGDDTDDNRDSTITATMLDGVHFAQNVSNTDLTIGGGYMDVFQPSTETYVGLFTDNGVIINSGNDGIGIDKSISNSDFFFGKNTINSSDNGAEFFGAVTDTDIIFTGNTITSKNDGIDFDNTVVDSTIRVGSLSGEYAGNTISSGQSGVEFGKLPLAGSVIDGVEIELYGNTIDAGVHAFALDGNVNDTYVAIQGNNRLHGVQRGVSVASGDLTGGTTVEVIGNYSIYGETRDGILVQDLAYGGASAYVEDNYSIVGGDDGVDFRNISEGSIYYNYIHNSTKNGVHLRGSKNIVLADNLIINNSTGVLLYDVNNVLLDNNYIIQNLFYGLHADGKDNGSIVLAGNEFINNIVGARFESGQINLDGGEKANLYQIFYEGGEGTRSARTQSPFAYEGAQFVGIQFDGSPSLLTITGETLGNTRFVGYGALPVGSAYYVRFENGSILNPVTSAPILIDGNFANWDGLVPNGFTGFLASAERQAIEDRLFDADDAAVNGRGQIFQSPTVENENQDGLGNVEDFFRDFRNLDAKSNQASLRVLGLPPVTLAQASAGTSGASLNNLAPQAGGNQPATNSQVIANIEPAAGEGTEAKDASAIEPAAGANDQQVTCWGDALNSLGAGAVTYNFGGTFEDGLAQETGCRTNAEAL